MTDSHDHALRPPTLAEFAGQARLKPMLSMAIAAARKRSQAMDHTLFIGPPGLGKTTLANIIAHELGVNLRATSGPAIELGADLELQLWNLGKGDVLFIDEIHRMPRALEEVLYPAMEDFQIDVLMHQKGKAPAHQKLAVGPFTLIGATTRSGMLSSPLRDRFGQHYHLDFYNQDELEAIVRRSAQLLGLSLEPEACAELARRSRGTPRIANRMLRRVRDYAEVHDTSVVTREVALNTCELMGIDACGFDRMDRALLDYLIANDGKPVGLKTLAAAVGEGTETIEDVYEPYLLQEGFIARTPRGRVATAKACAHLGHEAQKAA